MPNASSDYKIIFNNAEFPESIKPFITNIEHEESFEETAKVTIEIADHENFLSPDVFLLDTPMELYLGYGTELENVFGGDLIKITPAFPDNETAKLNIIFYDKSYILKKVPKPRVYTNPNLLSIAKEIAKDNQLEIIVDPENILKDFKFEKDQSITQTDETDWQLLNKLAEPGNYKIFVRNKTIYIVDDNYLLKEQEDKFTFIYNPSDEIDHDTNFPCLDFVPSVGSEGQRVQVEVISWASVDADGKKYGKSKLDQANIDGLGYSRIRVKTKNYETLTVTGEIAKTDAQAKALATAEIQRRADNLITADATVPGNSKLHCGQKHSFKLNSLGLFGQKFSGDYIITEVKNNLVDEEKGFVTALKLRKSGLAV